MEKKRLVSGFVVVLGLVFSLIFISNVLAVDDLMALQGNVKQSGVNLASGDLVVTIYDSQSGGTMIYNSTTDFNGAISDGKYDVLLGNGTNELSLNYGQLYYMELYIDNEMFTFTDGSTRKMFQSSVGNVSASTIEIIDAGDFYNSTSLEGVLTEVGSQLGSSSSNSTTVWKYPVLDKDLASPPGTPEDGDRYIVSASADWYSNAWANRRKLTSDNTKVLADETDAFLVVEINGVDEVFNAAQNDGEDILFTSSDGQTRLDHHLEMFDTGNSRLVAYVKVPSLSSSADEELYMYYNNSESGDMGANPTGIVFPDEYGLFYEMDSAGGFDLTNNGRNYYGNVGSPSADNGNYGKGVSFSNGNAWSMRDVAYWEQEWDTRTHNVIFKTGADVSTRQVIFAEGGSVNGVMLYIYDGNLYARWWSESKGWSGGHHSTAVSTNTDYYATLSYSYPGNYVLYVNGVQVGSTATSAVMNAHSGNGGIGYTGTDTKDFHDTTTSGAYFLGTIKEFSVSDTDWNENKHDTWYNNRGDNSGFWTDAGHSVPGGASGDWSGQENSIAIYNDTAGNWSFNSPDTGWTVYVSDEGIPYSWSGVFWSTYQTGLNHNSLAGLQGGFENDENSEYYHLREDEYSEATRYANESQTGLMTSAFAKLVNLNSQITNAIKGLLNQSIPFIVDGEVTEDEDFNFDPTSRVLNTPNLTVNNSVGVGTNNPTQKLDVRGNGNFSGTVYINNDTDVSTLEGIWENVSGTATYDGDVNITGTFYGDGSGLTGISTYNATYAGAVNNASYLSTYNATYASKYGLNDNAQFNNLNVTNILRIGGSELIYSPGSGLDVNTSGDINFNGGWEDNGVTISDGDVYVSTLYVYNVTSLQVNHINTNGSLIPSIDNQFDLGSSTGRWRDAYVAGNIYSNGTVYGDGSSSSILGVPYNTAGYFNSGVQSLGGNSVGVFGQTNRSAQYGHSYGVWGYGEVGNARSSQFVYGVYGQGKTSGGGIASVTGVYAKAEGNGKYHYGLQVLNIGSGTTNYGLYSNVTGATTDYGVYTLNEDYNYFSGDVGIGTTSPSRKLDVRGIGNFSGTVYINNNTDVSTLGSTYNATYAGLINNASYLSTYNATYDAKQAGRWNVSGTDLYPEDLSYNVGIGTTSPSRKLDVAGSVNISGSGGVLYLNPSGLEDNPRIIFKQGSYFSESATSPVLSFYGDELRVDEYLTVNNSFYAGRGGDVVINNEILANKETFRYDASEDEFYIAHKDTATNGVTKVGIGTTGPKSKLHVNGSLIIGAEFAGGDLISDRNSIAMGIATYGGLINATLGGFAGGCVFGSEKIETNSSSPGQFAFGLAAGGSILATGLGSVAMGYATSGGDLNASGAGSIAMGENVQAVAANTLSFGDSFINDVASSFAVGFGAKDFSVKNGEVNVYDNNITSVDCITFSSGGKICSS